MPSLLITTFGLFLSLYHYAEAVEVVLLNTRNIRGGERLNWQTHANESDSSGRMGFRESSFNIDSGDTIRIYSACNVDQPGVDNWLRTPFIARGQATTLKVEIKFTMRRCTLHPDPTRLKRCSENFELFYHEAESDFANAMRPTWDAATWTHVDTIAGDKTFTDLRSFSWKSVNTETRSITVKRRGVYLAVRDSGACLAVISIRIYYQMCPAVTINLVAYPNTTIGESDEVKQIKGSCVGNAAIQKAPSYMCSKSGSWSYPVGACQCLSGFQSRNEQACTACPIGSYKWHTSESTCERCPPHSEAPKPGAVQCRCRKDYFRSLDDPKSTPCTRPPSGPRNVTVTYLDQSSVNLSWLSPTETGGRSDLRYQLHCADCPSGTLYRPHRDVFNGTRAALLGLRPDTRYHIVLRALNGVSAVSGDLKSGEVPVVVRTHDALPTRVQNVHVSSVGYRSVTLSWSAEAHTDDSSVGVLRMSRFEVQTFASDSPANVSTVFTRNRNLTLGRLAADTAYVFRVRGFSEKGWGQLSNPVVATTGQLLGPTKGNDRVEQSVREHTIGIIAGSAVAVLACMLLVLVLVLFLLRRNHRACNDKNVSDCDTLQYSNVQCPPVLDGVHMYQTGMTVPLFTPPGGIRTYIDPHTYEDPNQAVREFTKEIDASLITIELVIGGGEFGEVCKGRLRWPSTLALTNTGTHKLAGGEVTVAIKTLKPGASDKNRLDFLTEASIMGQFEDANVIYLQGVVTKSSPIMIVTEYMENGSLDNFLRNNDGNLTVHQLVGMMRGISSGMRYLSDMGYVHRDLAARNILVNESLICKVADFGLSREIESDNTDGAYTTKGGKIPVRWTAPEAIAYRKFTSSSDAWSYGVVMWEVMSFGERPYWNWSNQDVIREVEKGFRLPPPMECPEAVHQLMLDCWQKDRCHRPKFASIVKTHDKLIRAPELLRKIAKPPTQCYMDSASCPTDACNFDNLQTWLALLKMERYTENFLSAGISSLTHVAALSLKDLQAIGITLVGHQKKILNSVQSLRAQLNGQVQVSPGFLV